MMTLYNKQTINQHFLLHLVPSLYIYPSSFVKLKMNPSPQGVNLPRLSTVVLLLEDFRGYRGLCIFLSMYGRPCHLPTKK